MAVKEITHIDFHMSRVINCRDPLQLMFRLISELEKHGMKVSSRHVKLEAGRKVFEAELVWKRQLYHVELKVVVQISGWEYMRSGRLEIDATGFQILSLEYSGMFGEIAADVISEHYAPLEMKKRRSIQNIISKIEKLISE